MEVSVPGYQFVNFLKSGAQAAVVQAKKNGIDYAVRIISDLQNPINVARAVRELLLLRNCCHENIIEILDISIDLNLNKLERLYITVPLMDYTFEEFAKIDLWRNEKQNFYIRFFMIQILRGIDYLHRNSILHRDLSSRNIMIKRNLHLKIIDFGLAREQHNFATMAAFTLPYQAPERVLEFESYDSKVDMWSVGCLFAELISGHRLFLTSPSSFPHLQLLQQSFSLEDKVPQFFQTQLRQFYTEKEIQYVNDRIYQPIENRFNFPSPNQKFDDIQAHSSQNGLNVLKNLLRLYPEKRWSAEQTLKCPFFADTAPRNKTLKNPTECQLVFEQINFANDKEDINQLKVLLQKQIQLAPRL
uniref:Protein kinase domain-containing protein n=1 Tax=Panagrolaimus sp. PS1159 TaxID=55785 RepID=A0AC35GBL5_9BILA